MDIEHGRLLARVASGTSRLHVLIMRLKGYYVSDSCAGRDIIINIYYYILSTCYLMLFNIVFCPKWEIGRGLTNQ